MKKIYFLIFLLSFKCASAQQYYLHNGQQIRFREDTTTNLISYKSVNIWNYSDRGASMDLTTICRLIPFTFLLPS